MMLRRKFIGAIALAAVAPPRVTTGQPARKLPIVGVMLTTSLTTGASAQTIAALREGLRQSGYVERPSRRQHYRTVPQSFGAYRQMAGAVAHRHAGDSGRRGTVGLHDRRGAAPRCERMRARWASSFALSSCAPAMMSPLASAPR